VVGMNRLECIVIGYNETTFETYEGWLRNYGEDSEAYRDLKYSFVEVDRQKLRFVFAGLDWPRPASKAI